MFSFIMDFKESSGERQVVTKWDRDIQQNNNNNKRKTEIKTTILWYPSPSLNKENKMLNSQSMQFNYMLLNFKKI